MFFLNLPIYEISIKKINVITDYSIKEYEKHHNIIEIFGFLH